MNQPKNMPVVAGQVTTGEEQQYLTFMLGGEMFAIGILNIKEKEYLRNLPYLRLIMFKKSKIVLFLIHQMNKVAQDT